MTTDVSSQERFFTAARARRGDYGWGRVAAGFAALILGIVAVTVATSVAFSGQKDPGPVGQVVQSAVPLIGWGLVAVLVGRFVFSMRPADLISGRPGMRWGLFARSLAVALVGFGAMYGVLLVQSDKPILTTTPVLLGVLAVVLLIPFQAMSEELVFRGLGVQMVLGKIGWSNAKALGVGVLLSAAFVALHSSGEPAVFLAIASLALFFTILTWRLAGLEGAFAVHIANNVLLLGSKVLHGENLVKAVGNQKSSVTASLVQIVVAALVTAVIILLARRDERRSAA